MRILICLTLGAFLHATTMADTLSISDPRPAVHVPERGMNMDQVESNFGAPNERIAAVGEPPIARWVYGQYTVYFEHQLVLHSVVHQPGRP
jgi:hypothetical protein